MYNANYMDGVPVKIAERYKPPPAIYNNLPQSLANKLNLEDNYYQNSPLYSYNLQLEHKALSKIEQWKRIRQRNKELRRERIERREQQRKREDECRQKNLLCSVSYPSTDDLSSSSGGEDEVAESNVGHDENCRVNTESKETAPQICVTETTNSFHNILQPTVLSNYNSSCINSSNNTLTPLIKSTFEGKLSNSFNYKDFEDDTSSPFDNIELKTINDLDVLAQVLHNTQMKSSHPVTDEIHSLAISSDDTTKSDPEEQNEFDPSLPSPLHVENIPKPNNNSLPRFNYDFNSTQGAITDLRNHHTTAAIYNANLPTLSPQHHHLQHQGLNNVNDYYSMNPNRSNDCNNQNALNVDKSQYDKILALQADDHVTKVKSVPDILKELRDEIRSSEMRRSRNCSYHMGESAHINDVASLTNAIAPIINDATENSDIFSQLDGKGKQLAAQIIAMGFPQKRVARIVQLVGADDKKIIEHLIPLSELADLGFDETKISEALIRHENNKNKALDDLIS